MKFVTDEAELDVDFTYGDREAVRREVGVVVNVSWKNGKTGPNAVTGGAICSERDAFRKAVGRKVALTKAFEVLPQLSKASRTQFWNQYINEKKCHVE